MRAERVESFRFTKSILTILAPPVTRVSLWHSSPSADPLPPSVTSIRNIRATTAARMSLLSVIHAARRPLRLNVRCFGANGPKIG